MLNLELHYKCSFSKKSLSRNKLTVYYNQWAASKVFYSSVKKIKELTSLNRVGADFKVHLNVRHSARYSDNLVFPRAPFRNKPSKHILRRNKSKIIVRAGLEFKNTKQNAVKKKKIKFISEMCGHFGVKSSRDFKKIKLFILKVSRLNFVDSKIFKYVRAVFIKNFFKKHLADAIILINLKYIYKMFKNKYLLKKILKKSLYMYASKYRKRGFAYIDRDLFCKFYCQILSVTVFCELKYNQEDFINLWSYNLYNNDRFLNDTQMIVDTEMGFCIVNDCMISDYEQRDWYDDLTFINFLAIYFIDLNDFHYVCESMYTPLPNWNKIYYTEIERMQSKRAHNFYLNLILYDSDYNSTKIRNYYTTDRAYTIFSDLIISLLFIKKLDHNICLSEENISFFYNKSNLFEKIITQRLFDYCHYNWTSNQKRIIRVRHFTNLLYFFEKERCHDSYGCVSHLPANKAQQRDENYKKKHESEVLIKNLENLARFLNPSGGHLIKVLRSMPVSIENFLWQ